MRTHVFTDGRLAKQAGRFVWLSIDTEKQQNAGFLSRYPVEAWPTIYVIDERTGEPVLKWAGGGTVDQLEKLFADAERTLAAPQGRNADTTLAAADRSWAKGQREDAITGYVAALESGGPAWPRRGRCVESLLFALWSTRQLARCAELGERELPTLARGPSFANAAGMALSCALAGDPEAAFRASALAKLEPWVVEALALPDLLADDRSGLYDQLAEARAAAGDTEGSQKVCGQWLAFLEKEAASARSPEARAAFDAHRVSAALRLGEPERVEAALLASERDLPRDYNAPARLALVYKELGRFAEALAAAERALAHVDGPRRIRVLETKASILAEKQERAAQVVVLEDALAFARSLPPAQVPAGAVERLEKSLAQARGAAARDQEKK